MASASHAQNNQTSKWSQGLSGPALEIAGSHESRLRVCAGPGTGKTSALMRRVARLLEEGVPPNRIFLVTFTRTAASDLVKGLEELGVPGAKQVRVGTLHSFCYQVLSQDQVLKVVGRNPRPLMKFEERFLHEDLRKPGRGVRDCQRLIRAFEASWARLQHDTPGWPHDPCEQEFHRDLMDWLVEHRCILLGELITEMRRYLRDNPTAPARHAFDHVLVDEYQDLNRADQEVIDLLAERGTLTIIGDEDQAIYSRLRFAQPESIRDFSNRHPSTHDVPLEECRRCPTRIVEMANNLISQNRMRAQRQLKPQAGNPAGDVQIIQWHSMEEEAEGIAKIVKDYVCKTGARLKEVLVLAPRRSIGYRIRDCLYEVDVDAHSYFFEEALGSDLAKERFTLLNLLVNRLDRVSLRSWLGFGHHIYAATQYRRLREYCKEHGLEPIEALERIQSGSANLPQCDWLVERYVALDQQLGELQKLEVADLVDALFPADESEVADLREMAVMAIQESRQPLDTRRLLGDLRTRIIYPEPPAEGEYVRIMSLHKSKGLKARLVVVASCVEGCIPSLDTGLTGAEAERDLEEQRRLFYVAITRPTDALVLSSFRTMPVVDAFEMQIQFQSRDGDRATVHASRFLSELGPTAPRPQLGTVYSSFWPDT